MGHVPFRSRRGSSAPFQPEQNTGRYLTSLFWEALYFHVTTSKMGQNDNGTNLPRMKKAQRLVGNMKVNKLDGSCSPNVLIYLCHIGKLK